MTNKPETGSVWRHKKCGTTYKVLYYAMFPSQDERDGPVCIIYQATEMDKNDANVVRVLLLREFIDGRFEALKPRYALTFLVGEKNQQREKEIFDLDGETLIDAVNRLAKEKYGGDIYSLSEGDFPKIINECSQKHQTGYTVGIVEEIWK